MTAPIRREDYTVGWLCALHLELTAAQEMLDEQYQSSSNDANDSNVYTLGRIDKHNIVIACLPQIGTIPAAVAATQMNAAFPSIRFWLMVGVGGGVPSEKADIRLGDVVVSRPDGVHGGVVQYDLGKSHPGGFVRTGSLNSPSSLLLAVAQNLRAHHLRAGGKSKFLEYVSKFDGLPNFARKNTGPDVLFQADFDHEKGINIECGNCSKEKVLVRQPRSDKVMIHYGTIASGNQVIRDGATRDRVSADIGDILCFEMEAAGLMNHLQCIVIRGICDYADSHKNKRWQAYAAGTAAAYAKEMVTLIPIQKTTSEEAENIPLASTSETSKPEEINPATLNPTGPNSAMASNITWLNFTGSNYITLNSAVSTFTVSNPGASTPVAPRPAVLTVSKRRRMDRYWMNGDFVEEDDEDEEGPPIKCYFCGELGHTKPNCRKNKCYDCREVGHWTGDPECKYSRRYLPKSRTPAYKTNWRPGLCDICGEPGHWKDTCPDWDMY